MTTTQTPTIVSVDLREDTLDGLFHGWYVEPIWADVDRPNTGGWFLGDLSLAVRLAAAVGAGKVFYDAHVATDVNGQTYVAASSRVMAKYAASDLRAIGF